MKAMVLNKEIIFFGRYLNDRRAQVVSFRVDNRDHEAVRCAETGKWHCEFRGELASNARTSFDQACEGFYGPDPRALPAQLELVVE